jgi:hypothetical protein
MMHVPSFMERAEELRGKGIQGIFCVSVNDCFVMDAWGKVCGKALQPLTNIVHYEIQNQAMRSICKAIRSIAHLG